MKKLLILILILGSCSKEAEEKLPPDLVGSVNSPFIGSVLSGIPLSIPCFVTNIKDLNFPTCTAPASFACLEIRFREDSINSWSTIENFKIAFPSIPSDSTVIRSVEYSFFADGQYEFKLHPDFDNQILERNETIYEGECL